MEITRRDEYVIYREWEHLAPMKLLKSSDEKNCYQQYGIIKLTRGDNAECNGSWTLS